MRKQLEIELMMQMNALNGSKILALSSIDSVFKAINKALGLNYIDLSSNRRFTDLVEARYIAYHFLHTELDLAPGKICTYFNNDRTTVIHGLNKCLQFIEIDKDFQKKFYLVNKHLFNNSLHEN